MENEISANMLLNKVLNGMNDDNKNKLIMLLIEHDIKDILINQTPIYGELRHNGILIMRYIKDYEYTVELKPTSTICVDELLTNKNE